MIFMVVLMVCPRLCSSAATTTGVIHGVTCTLNSVLSQLHTAVDN